MLENEQLVITCKGVGQV